MSHKHGCKPVVFPNGALNIEGTLENLTSLWRAFWTRRFSPRFVTDERVDGQTVPGFSPRIEIHPQVALRKAKVKDGIPVGPSRGPCRNNFV